MQVKTYMLTELPEVNIDSWVEAMGHIAEEYGDEIATRCNYRPGEDCPAEYEAEFTAVANEAGCRFLADGSLLDLRARV